MNKIISEISIGGLNIASMFRICKLVRSVEIYTNYALYS